MTGGGSRNRAAWAGGRRPAAAVLAVLVLAGCRATSPRPSFTPFPESPHGEVGFGLADPLASIVRVTRTVADALRADSIPVGRVHEAAGYVESPWFDARTLAPTAARPLGPDVVRVRAWVGPARPGFSTVEVEAVYRPLADPSLPARELEAPVPDGHPVGRRVAELVKRLVAEHGIPSDSAAVRPAQGPPPAPAAGVGPPGDRPDPS